MDFSSLSPNKGRRGGHSFLSSENELASSFPVSNESFDQFSFWPLLLLAEVARAPPGRGSSFVPFSSEMNLGGKS